MEKYIYKIENLVNHKLYIGQSNDPKRRFEEHCSICKESSLIYLAILKYGKDNFEMTILEGPISNYNEREKYWISYFHTYVKDPLYKGGYNLTEGGEDPPVLLGEKNPATTHTIEQVQMAKRLLKETDIPLPVIAECYGYVDDSAIGRINMGKIWNDPEEEYPLRVLPRSKVASQRRWETIADLLYTTDLTQKEIAKMCGCERSCVTMINIGKNGQEYNHGKYKYPIRTGNMSYKQSEKVAAQIAYDLANTNLSYEELSKKYSFGKTFISLVNQGKNYKFDSYVYPIR